MVRGGAAGCQGGAVRYCERRWLRRWWWWSPLFGRQLRLGARSKCVARSTDTSSRAAATSERLGRSSGGGALQKHSFSPLQIFLFLFLSTSSSSSPALQSSILLPPLNTSELATLSTDFAHTRLLTKTSTRHERGCCPSQCSCLTAVLSLTCELSGSYGQERWRWVRDSIGLKASPAPLAIVGECVP